MSTTPDPPALTDADLDRLEALCATALPGPWFNASAVSVDAAHDADLAAGDHPYRVANTWSGPFAPSRELARANAEFIAAAREAVPQLVAELRAARARCEGLAERVAQQSELLSRRAERPG